MTTLIETDVLIVGSGPCGGAMALALATLDLCGNGRFTLLTGISGSAWVDAAQKVTQETGVEIKSWVIGPGRDVEDIYQEWAEIREVAEDGCLLVRPDGYIAWRSQGMPENCIESLRNVMRQILGK